MKCFSSLDELHKSASGHLPRLWLGKARGVERAEFKMALCPSELSSECQVFCYGYESKFHVSVPKGVFKCSCMSVIVNQLSLIFRVTEI